MHGENDNRNNNGIDIGKTAVAIEYVPGEAAPKILATGKGVIADKIIERYLFLLMIWIILRQKLTKDSV